MSCVFNNEIELSVAVSPWSSSMCMASVISSEFCRSSGTLSDDAGACFCSFVLMLSELRVTNWLLQVVSSVIVSSGCYCVTNWSL